MHITHRDLPEYPEFEVVERKGWGHPDSLSDGLAEELSRAYSVYTRERFGAVLHHNFDKVGLLGGGSEVAFGRAKITSPIRVLVNGRVSSSFAGAEIPIEDLVVETARRFLGERLANIDPETDLVFLWNLSTGSSPGHMTASAEGDGSRHHWFAPRSLADLRELTHLTCNDTSLGSAYAPHSPLERFLLSIEDHLREKTGPWLGGDIKMLAVREGTAVQLTMCIPQIASEVADLEGYVANLALARAQVQELAGRIMPEYTLTLATNTRDDLSRPELYLTATGSSIESGDEGLVGRGNRINGLIATGRPYSMEGVCGKNPVYHTGKLYYICAQRIAERLTDASGGPVHVWVVGQSGRDLKDPWRVEVSHLKPLSQETIEKEVAAVMDDVTSVTDDLLAGTVRLY